MPAVRDVDGFMTRSIRRNGNARLKVVAVLHERGVVAANGSREGQTIGGIGGGM